ncbi:MAG: thioredoxin family protein [Candidatus Bathyarchaeota archaeon]|nr:thioredoxin family protein [Candidatus Bathyarchaeota archaeon]
MKVLVECMGLDPPCARCKKLEENALRVADKLRGEGIDVEVVKWDIMSPEVTKIYGVLMSPAVVVNGVVRVNGKLPDERVIERYVREAL